MFVWKKYNRYVAMDQPVATQLDHLQPQTGRMALLKVLLSIIIHTSHIYDLNQSTFTLIKYSPL